ncbi:MAG: sulfate transporter CysZ [Gammaproteobacteria bacterium]|nr:sulfate transporter CysZ [Gammaproteobacteria bacterium]
MTQLFAGARYLLRGFGLIHQQGIRKFAYIPIAINTVLFSFAIWLGISKFDHWMNSMMPTWMPEWLLAVLMWIIWPLFTALISLVVFFTFSIVANLLAAPFNGVLAEAVEVKLAGQAPTEIPWQKIIKETPLMLWNELRKLLYVLMWLIPLFILSWIPVVNFVAPVLWVAFSSWMLALDYHDYPMANHQILFAQQRQILKQKRLLTLGFGLATLGATMIPFVNFLVIPAAVAGATALYLERLK